MGFPFPIDRLSRGMGRHHRTDDAASGYGTDRRTHGCLPADSLDLRPSTFPCLRTPSGSHRWRSEIPQTRPGLAAWAACPIPASGPNQLKRAACGGPTKTKKGEQVTCSCIIHHIPLIPRNQDFSVCFANRYQTRRETNREKG